MYAEKDFEGKLEKHHIPLDLENTKEMEQENWRAEFSLNYQNLCTILKKVLAFDKHGTIVRHLKEK